MYEYGIIDAQYILVRNRMLQTNYSEDSRVNTPGLLKLFIQSIMKLKRDYEFKYAILLWDKRPYYKEKCFEDYKGDRWIPSKDDKEYQLSIINNPESTEDERLKAEITLSQIELEEFNYSIQQEVKFKVINELPDLGFKSIIKEGFEADDLAYICSEYLNSNNLTGVLLSADSDWINFNRGIVDSISIKNNSKFDSLKEYRNSYLQYVDGSIYDYGILYELYWGGHNNIGGYTDEVSFEDFLYRMYNHDPSLPNYSYFENLYRGMDIRPHMNEILPRIKDTLSDRFCKSSEFSEYMIYNSFSVNFSSYMSFVGDYND